MSNKVNIPRVSVRNMTSSRGRKVPNQFIIWIDDMELFQSYQSIIVALVGRQVYLDSTYWDYSRTTGKYRNQFLHETKRETESKIKSGEYILTDLNKEGW